MKTILNLKKVISSPWTIFWLAILAAFVDTNLRSEEPSKWLLANFQFCPSRSRRNFNSEWLKHAHIISNRASFSREICLLPFGKSADFSRGSRSCKKASSSSSVWVGFFDAQKPLPSLAVSAAAAAAHCDYQAQTETSAQKTESQSGFFTGCGVKNVLENGGFFVDFKTSLKSLISKCLAGKRRRPKRPLPKAQKWSRIFLQRTSKKWERFLNWKLFVRRPRKR